MRVIAYFLIANLILNQGLFSSNAYAEGDSGFQFKCKGKTAAVSIGASVLLAVPAIAISSIKGGNSKPATDESGKVIDPNIDPATGQPLSTPTVTKADQYQSYKNAAGDSENSRNWLTGSAAVIGVVATVDGVLAAQSVASGDTKEAAKCIASAAVLGVLAGVQVIQIGLAEDARKKNLAEADKLVSTCKTTLSICGTVANKSIPLPSDCTMDSKDTVCTKIIEDKWKLDSTKEKYRCDDSVALMDCAAVVKAADPTSAAGKITDQQMAAAINKGLNSAFGSNVATSTSGVYTPAEIDAICKAAGMTLDDPRCVKFHAEQDGKSKSSVKLAGLADQLEKNTAVKVPSDIINALKNPTESNLKAATKALADSPMGANLFSASEKEQMKAGNLKALAGLGKSDAESNTIAGTAKKKSSGESFDPFGNSGKVESGSGSTETNLQGEMFSSRLSTAGDINTNTNESIFKMISEQYGKKYRLMRD